MARVDYKCFVCGKSVRRAAGFCSVNFHRYNNLIPNKQRNGYLGWFQQGAAHLSCIDPLLGEAKERPETCVVCHKKIRSLMGLGCSQLAVYIYRKPGCAAILGIHDKCLRGVIVKEFPVVKI